MSHHQHSHTAKNPNHFLRLRNKFLEYMHDTELWASYLPRIPWITILLAVVGLSIIVASFIALGLDSTLLKISSLVLGSLLILPIVFAGNFAFRKWKYVQAVRKQILDSIPWRGDEKVLDIGCGSGLLLNGAATRLTTGKAIGIDIWAPRSGGGSYSLLMRNAKAEKVADKIEFKQVDVRQLPFEDASFDVILSSGALHHISHNLPDHELAIKEMTRVLKPGGRIILWDTTHMVTAYASRMKASGIESEVTKSDSSMLGFEMSMMAGSKVK